MHTLILYIEQQLFSNQGLSRAMLLSLPLSELRIRQMRVAILLVVAAIARASDLEPLPAESSPLAKFVLTLSRPGAFNKTQDLFGTEPPHVTSCPLGPEGLACRQAEARRVIDNCPGGDCESCVRCDEVTANGWPYCCQHNGQCCSQLAKACQTCKITALRSFCAKNFKRCY